MRRNMMKYAAICSLIPAMAFAEPGFMDGPPPGEGMPMPQGTHRFPDGAHGHRPSPRDMLMKSLSELNLTETQQSQIKALLNKDEAEIHSQFETLHEVHGELRRLALSTAYSDDKAKAIAAKAQPVHEQLMLHKAHVDNEIFKLLTPEQQQKWQQHPMMDGPPPGFK